MKTYHSQKKKKEYIYNGSFDPHPVRSHLWHLLCASPYPMSPTTEDLGCALPLQSKWNTSSCVPE